MTQAAQDTPLVTVVLPCLDEAASVVGCIEEARLGLAEAGLTGEVLVIDNGSTDGSSRLARDAGARVVREPIEGYGAALQRGLEEARGSIVVMADSDGTYDLSRLDRLVAPLLADDADLVLGNRFNGRKRKTMPLLHRFVGTPILSFLVRRACSGLAVQDSQTGYRAAHARQLNALHLQTPGMEFASEMLIRASQQGLRVNEVPLGYRPRVGSSKLHSLRDGWRHLRLIFLLAPHLLLFWPGIAMLGLGLLLSILSLLNPMGFELGPVRWQPIFIGPILMTLGTMAALSGAVMAHHSSLISRKVMRHFSVVGDKRFALGCAAVGTLAMTAGLAIDLVLFAVWIAGSSSPERALGLAGLAQSLVITGAVLAAFGLVYRMLAHQSGYRNRAVTANAAEMLELIHEAARGTDREP